MKKLIESIKAVRPGHLLRLRDAELCIRLR